MQDIYSKLENSKKNLIDNLLKKGIKDQDILGALSKVRRENFVLNEYYERAYDDSALPILDGQTISQPFTVCLMLELLEIKKGLKVLEIGTGSGYLTTLLFELGLEVFSIERSQILFESANKMLKSLNINANLKLGDGTEGWIEQAPYDRVIISAASPIFPDYLSNQLNDGAIIVCPVGDKNSQTMIKGIFRNNRFDLSKHDDFRFVPLVGKKGWDAR